jgi:hypothetical protein
MRRIGLLMLCAAMAANAATLIHSYTFGTAVTDGTGSENGTLYGGASVSGGVLNLDGADDYVEFGTNLIPGSGSFSVLISAKLIIAPTSYREILSQGSSGNALYIGSEGGGGIRAGDQWPGTGVNYPTDGEWHTFAFVRDEGNSVTKFYLDGTVYSHLLTTNPAASETRFGRQYGGNSEYFAGQLDDVRIYSGALTDGEVVTLGSGSESVPEPWSFGLTGAGLLAVGLHHRRRWKSTASRSGLRR